MFKYFPNWFLSADVKYIFQNLLQQSSIQVLKVNNFFFIFFSKVLKNKLDKAPFVNTKNLIKEKLGI